MSKAITNNGDVVSKIGSNDAVLIIREDGSHEIAIPPCDDDSLIELTSPTWKITMAMMIFSDDELFDRVSDLVQESMGVSSEFLGFGGYE